MCACVLACVCVCVCVCVCLSVCVCVCVCLCVYVCEHMHWRVCVTWNARLDAGMQDCVGLWMSACLLLSFFFIAN